MKENNIVWLRALPAPVRTRLRPHLTRLERPVAILAYHRVIDLPSDPQLLAVSPAHFAEHLEIIRKHALPIPLGIVPCAVDHERSAGPCVAVTFDDGYFDNLEFAKPLLDRCAVLATVFVVTGHMGAGREFWWDDLERMLLLPRKLPPVLDLDMGSTVLHWSIKDECDASDPAWNVARSPLHTRQGVYLTLMNELSCLAPAQRDAVLARLADWSGVGSAGRDLCRRMTCAELRSLRAGGLVSLGAHTHAHPMLARLAPLHQRAEIETSKHWLERQFGDPVMNFAYPHGTSDAYSRHTARLVCQAGFECACSTAARAVSALDDPFELPRFTVRNWGAAEFESRLKGWLRL